MAGEPQVNDTGEHVVIDVPAGVTYAALGLRVKADSEDAIYNAVLDLSGRFAQAVLDYSEGTPEAEVTIVQGPEAVVAFDIASRQTAEHLGLEGHRHVLEPDRDMLADHLRRHFARAMGLDPNTLVAFDQLKESEQRTWQGHADACAEFLRGM